jgi:predicted DCC family thiol-disulfide oxidoreductase YuxK
MDTASLPQDVVIFDGDCGICNATREWAEARDRAGHLRFVPFQSADLDAVSPGLTAGMAGRMAWLITSGGRRFGGARAIFMILTRLPGVWPLLGAVGAFPPVNLLCEPFYRVIAANRSRISGWLGLTHCRVPEIPRHPTLV